MLDYLRNIIRKIFWLVYTPMSAELWVKICGNKKVEEVKELLSEFGKNLSTSEIGSAEGYITRRLALEGIISSGVAYDILPQRLEKGETRAKKENIADKVKFIHGDAKKLPFEDKEYDVVMLLDVLEHIPKKEDVIQSIKEAYRVTSRGVIISVPQTTFSKYVDIDHLRILMSKPNNSWIYNPRSFQTELRELGYNFRKISQRDGTYLIYKEEFTPIS